MGWELARGDPLAQPRVSTGVRSSGTARTRERWFVNTADESLLVRYGGRFATVMGDSGHGTV